MTDTSLLGFGFHVFGRADLGAGATMSVVKTTVRDTDDNVVANAGDAHTSLVANTFDTRDEVTAHMAASAGLNYSGTVFSGEFAAKYESESKTTTKTSYGLYEVTRPTSVARLANLDLDVLAEAFRTSDDVLNLPDTFDPANPEQFFRIFRRFGTHIVTEVTLGGKLTAYTSAHIDETNTSQTASANMKVEYEALFSSASATASQEWAKISDTWAGKREISFDVLGGDPSDLARFTPEYGSSAGDLVAGWLKSVAATPAIVGYNLQPLSVVFDGATGTAVDHAIRAYLTTLVRVEAWQHSFPRPAGPIDPPPTATRASTITLPGQLPVSQPEPAFGAAADGKEQQWLWLVMLDPENPQFGDQAFSQAYYLSPGIEERLNADIDAHRARGGGAANPLVVLCGEFARYGQGADTTQIVGTVIPASLRHLLSECGFDIQDQMTTWQVMALVGVANSGSPCIATSTSAFDTVDPDKLGPFSSPSTLVAQHDVGELTLVDAAGTLLSPVTQ